MKLLKTLAVASLLAASTGAMASPFYFDVGTNFSNADSATKVNPNSTAIKEYFGTQYFSQTLVNTSVANTLTVGDTITTYLGINPASANITAQTAATNYLTFVPSQPGSANNGLGNDWYLSFSTNNLTGKISSLADPLKPQVNYTGGTIALLVSLDAGTTFKTFANLNVTGSAYTTANNLQVTGNLGFAGLDPTLAAIFKQASGTSFYDAVVNQLAIATFELDQNLTTPTISIIDSTTAKLSGQHGGQLRVNIPEPATLALLGIGLVGIGASRRKTA